MLHANTPTSIVAFLISIDYLTKLPSISVVGVIIGGKDSCFLHTIHKSVSKLCFRRPNVLHLEISHYICRPASTNATNMIEIVEIKTFVPAYMEEIQRLIEQLTSRPIQLTEATFKEIISQANTHLFVALADQKIIGMLTVAIYHSPTGGKAWIEDVVVDQCMRGQGVGKQLVAHAIRFVKEQHIPQLLLTSNPSRISANQLYQGLCFEPKPTNVYRMTFE